MASVNVGLYAYRNAYQLAQAGSDSGQIGFAGRVCEVQGVFLGKQRGQTIFGVDGYQG